MSDIVKRIRQRLASDQYMSSENYLCLSDAAETIQKLRDELKDYKEEVHQALGCTDGDDIRAHLGYWENK